MARAAAAAALAGAGTRGACNAYTHFTASVRTGAAVTMHSARLAGWPTGPLVGRLAHRARLNSLAGPAGWLAASRGPTARARDTEDRFTDLRFHSLWRSSLVALRSPLRPLLREAGSLRIIMLQAGQLAGPSAGQPASRPASQYLDLDTSESLGRRHRSRRRRRRRRRLRLLCAASAGGPAGVEPGSKRRMGPPASSAGPSRPSCALAGPSSLPLWSALRPGPVRGLQCAHTAHSARAPLRKPRALAHLD